MCLAATAASAQVTATSYDARQAVPVRMPLQGDSIDFTGKKFTYGRLLKTGIDLSFDKAACHRVEAGDDGYIAMENPTEGAVLYLYRTALRATRFAKGKLKVHSPARFEVFVNGESKLTVEEASDSLPQNPSETALRLEPEADYEIVIKLLASAQDKALPVLKCEFEKDGGFDSAECSMSPDMKRRFSLYDTAFGSRVASVSLSPDGKYLLTRYTDSYGPDRSRMHGELTEVKTGRMILPDVNGGMRWMPRSSRLYYTVTGKEGKRLVIFDPATMQEETLPADVPDGHFTWAPTEDFIIYTMTDEGERTEGPLKRILHPNDRIPGARNRSYLVRFDPATGLAERITYGNHSVYLNDISPDGTRLLCMAYREDIGQFPFREKSLVEIDMATLKADTLVACDPYINNASYSPDGTRLLLTGGPSAFGGIGKNCGSHPIANDYDVQAFIMDRSDRTVHPITRDFDPTVEWAEWNGADNCIYLSTTDKDCRHIYRYRPDKGSFEMLPLAEDVISGFSLPYANASVAAYVGGGSTSAGVAYMYDVRKEKSELIADPMRETLDAIELGSMEEWSFTAADGTRVEGMVCLPPDFDPQKKYPLIVYYYGGTSPTTRGLMSPYSPQLFASRDYVVYVVQPSGAIGYGQEFSARHVNAWGDYTADEIIEGTRKFCEAHPFVDATKIGCLGASYGGFMTMYLQTRTDIFAAAASHAGISNVTSYWGEGFWGYSYNSVAAAESYPWSNPELFTAHGALFNADKINTPLLLLHGTDDTNVPVGESIQLYNALKILGKPVELITVDGENHFISDYGKRVQWHNAIMAWFARWLQDSPQWWEDLYPDRHW